MRLSQPELEQIHRESRLLKASVPNGVQPFAHRTDIDRMDALTLAVGTEIFNNQLLACLDKAKTACYSRAVLRGPIAQLVRASGS